MSAFSSPKPLCSHLRHTPAYDAKAARYMTVEEVRKKFPRFWGMCADCGANVIMYASAEHFIMGDW